MLSHSFTSCLYILFLKHLLIVFAVSIWDKVPDSEVQATQWQDEEEMQNAVKFKYPVVLEPNKSMPEITLNMNGHISHSRKTRQSGDKPTPSMPCKASIVL